MIDLKLTALMSSKLCHDIIGPVGAVNNGIELLQDESNADMREQAVELVSQSAGEAAARLQFYRLAYGLASGMGAEVSVRDARALCRSFLSFGKVELDWPDEAGGAENLPKEAIKVICNLTAIAAGALSRGGKLVVSGDVADGNWSFEFRAAGMRAGLREEITKTLVDGYNEEELSTQNVGAQYMMAICENYGFKVEIASMEEDLVVLTAKSA
ncbi:histidine phosphotransferase family protein [Sneathiella limimaris]|uniref:histidine phosphotransferase family protein n=1 Tax=Sneathiella limimaris TaxID=1964213 RepID=UPI00146CC836|nr:histidine phosphotransferase family protein [Sneathiella limimaris]